MTADNPWHARASAEVLTALGTTPDGLSESEAVSRLARHGPNVLAAVPAASAFEILAAQLKSVVVLLLAAAALVSLVMHDTLEAAAILSVLVINTIVGFATEWRARRAIEALADLDVPHATVVRDGQRRQIEARHVVPGDVIAIESGRQVPADGRLIAVTDLRVDEAALTGESLPVSKDPAALLPDDTDLADRTTMTYKGTMAVAGFGRMVVTATGGQTEVGRIGRLVGSIRAEPTPLERQLDQLGRRLVWITLGIASVVGGLGLLQGMPLALVIETAIALAVAAVPEALPAVATVALAVGVHRMARRQALVRHLPAVESLGSVTVVCTDKTRTLTSGRMTLVRVSTDGGMVDPSDRTAVTPAVRDVIRAAMLASRPIAAGGRGDPVDIAMHEAGSGLSIEPRRGESQDASDFVIPFSSERKWMACVHGEPGGLVGYLKGAPVAVLDRCGVVFSDGHVVPIDAATRTRILEANDDMAREGLRVLAVARGAVPEASESALSGLTFLGLVGLADPPAAGVAETIERLRAAGLRTVMLTGDQRATAEAIGRQVGVLREGEDAVDGRALDERADDARMRLVRERSAFTRVTPEHKLTVVRMLRAQGEIVAMLGDGINDAAALRQADIGVAMGQRGTDVAKQAAGIVLQDDRFETIGAAVEEGRVIFDNIRKFVFYLFSCNLAEVLVLLVAGLLALPLPLHPLQLLWLNLVTDTFPALALALEPGEPGVMRRQPRQPGETLLSRAFLIEVAGYAGLITASTLAAYVWAIGHAPDQASAVAFMTLGFAQIWHLGNARSRGAVVSAARVVSNPFALAGVGTAVTLQVLAVRVAPLAGLLGVPALSLAEWGVIIGCSSIPALVGQVWKLAVLPRPGAAA